MISAGNVFLCAGLRAAEGYREVITTAGLNVEVQQYVSGRQLKMDFSGEVERLKQLKADLSLRYAFHAPFMHLNFWSKSDERAADAWNALAKSLDIAAQLESEFVVVHSLFVPRRRNPDYGPGWKKRAPRFFGDVAREAASRGLDVALENMLETGPDGLLWLVEEIDVDNVGVCLDVGHTAVAGGATPSEWVEGLGSALRHIHLSDNHGIHDDHMALGTGSVDIAGALTAAAAAPHEISLGLECRLRPAENVLRSLNFLASFDALGALGR